MEVPALIAEKTIFDLLGMLDSGERSLPFGRFVSYYTEQKRNVTYFLPYSSAPEHYFQIWLRISISVQTSA